MYIVAFRYFLKFTKGLMITSRRKLFLPTVRYLKFLTTFTLKSCTFPATQTLTILYSMSFEALISSDVSANSTNTLFLSSVFVS